MDPEKSSRLEIIITFILVVILIFYLNTQGALGLKSTYSDGFLSFQYPSHWSVEKNGKESGDYQYTIKGNTATIFIYNLSKHYNPNNASLEGAKDYFSSKYSNNNTVRGNSSLNNFSKELNEYHYVLNSKERTLTVDGKRAIEYTIEGAKMVPYNYDSSYSYADIYIIIEISPKNFMAIHFNYSSLSNIEFQKVNQSAYEIINSLKIS